MNSPCIKQNDSIFIWNQKLVYSYEIIEAMAEAKAGLVWKK